MATTTAVCRGVTPSRVTATARRSPQRSVSGARASATPLATTASSFADDELRSVEHCSGCPKGEQCPCPKAVRRHQRKLREQRQVNPVASRSGDGVNRRSLLAAVAAAAAASTVAPQGAFAMSSGLVSDAWSTISGAPSDLTFPDDFLGTWLCYSTLTAVSTPQGDGMVQDMAVVNRAKKDVGEQIIYPLRFIRNNQNRVVMDRAWNVVRMAEATARARNVIESVEWDVDDPNLLTATMPGDGRSVFFRVNQRSEEYPALDRIETSEVAQIVFDGGDNGGYAPKTGDASGILTDVMAGVTDTPSGAPSAKQPKIKSSRTFTKWKFRSVASAGDGPLIVAGQTVYDYLTSFDPGFLDSKGQPVTQYTYKLALFKANDVNNEN